MTEGDTVLVTGVAQHAAWRARTPPPVERVRPGLWSVPVPIPEHPLRYTLSYLFVGDDGVVVVDPGWDTAAGRDALAAGLATAGAGVADVRGVVVTHVHPDHHGLSGWLRETAGAWVAMHPAERDTLPARIWSGTTAVDTDRAWLREQGVPEGDLSALLVQLDPGSPLLAMAEPDRLVEDGDLLPIRGRQVRAVWTPGHTPGHLCLYDAAAGVLLTGDHLLPRISPTVGVHGGHDDDPLTGYLQSLRRMARYSDSEALPAHEYRFREVDTRAAYLLGHHRDRCTEIVTMLTAAGPATCWQIAGELSWSRGWTPLGGMMRRMALAETLAHLHHLRGVGTVGCDTGSPRLWRRREPAGADPTTG